MARNVSELPTRQYSISDNTYCCSHTPCGERLHDFNTVPRAIENRVFLHLCGRRPRAFAIRPNVGHHGIDQQRAPGTYHLVHVNESLGGWIKRFLKPRHAAGLSAAPSRPPDARIGQIGSFGPPPGPQGDPGSDKLRKGTRERPLRRPSSSQPSGRQKVGWYNTPL